MATRKKILKSESEDSTPKYASFEINAALFEELGERLVSKPEIALAELIKNSYDADADLCQLTLSDTAVVITDNGQGMTEDEFLHKWMVISTQNKGTERYSRKYFRHMAGSKGVGRFSARYLGNVVTLSTVADSENDGRTKLVATFDWREITKKISISKVQIPYRVVPAPKEPIGTRLEISDLRKETTQISANTVKTSVLKLTNPTAGLEKPPFQIKAAKARQQANKLAPIDPGFSVSFDQQDEAESGGLTPTLQKEILDAFTGRVRLEVLENGKLTYEVFWKGSVAPIEKKTISLAELTSTFTADALTPNDDDVETDERGLIKPVEEILHLPVAQSMNCPVFIDLRFFPKRKGAFSNLSANGTIALSWIRENASIALFDNNFAMESYSSEDSDWLAIDASKALNQRSWQSILTPALYPMGAAEKADTKLNPMLALPRTTQLIGQIHIATHKKSSLDNKDDSDDWLQPNMDRESLRSNGAFRLLWHVSRFATELLAHFDRKMRLLEEKQLYDRQTAESRTALSAAIREIRSSTQIQPEYRDHVVKQLKVVEARIAESQKYEKDARLSLELMSMMGVMAGFMTHEFEKAMDLLNQSALSLKKLAIVDPKLRELADSILEQEQALANYLDYMRVFIDRARDPVPQVFKAYAQVNRASKTLSPISIAHSIDVDIDIDTKLSGPQMPIAAYNGIVINLISNGLKALVPKISDEPKKIRLYATNEGTNHILVCADNGIGVPEFLRKRIWDPLFSTTKIDGNDDNPLGSGLGLGLSVVQQVVVKMGGKIELLEVPPPGFSTAFKVTLPLQLSET